MARNTTSQFTTIPALGHVPERELERFESLSTVVRIEAGDALMRQGAFGNEVALVLSGELLVDRDGEAIAVLSPGAVVGEQALLLNEPRNATVTAATSTLVAVMNRREFSTVLEECPTVAREILQTAVARAVAAVN